MRPRFSLNAKLPYDGTWMSETSLCDKLKVMMKEILTLLLWLTPLGSISAGSLMQDNTTRAVDVRQKIGIDYAVPDYITTRIEPEKTGARLAKILQLLERDYKQGVYNYSLSRILDSQIDGEKQHFLTIEKLKVRSIQKKDSMVVIRVQLQSAKTKELGRVKRDVDFVFVNGVSADDRVNDLFCGLAQYVKDDD